MDDSKGAPQLPPPKSKSRRVNVTLRGDIYEVLARLAEDRDEEPIATTAAVLIEDGLRRIGKL